MKVKNPVDENDKTMGEFEWEEFLKKNDVMVDKYSALMEKYIDDPNCDKIIAGEMGWNDRMEDDGIERPWLDDFNDSITQMVNKVEEGDEWKITAGIEDELDSDLSDFREDPLYQLGFYFAIVFRNWFKVLPEDIQSDPDMMEALVHSAIPGAKIAGAISIDDEDKDQLGFRLANYKRGLIASNKSLNALISFKEKNLVDLKYIFPIIKKATELRNALAIRVLEIRDRFNRL